MILKTADEILGTLERGNLSKDFAASIFKVIAAIQEMEEGKGSVTLKLSIGVKDQVVSVKGKLEEVIPKRDRKSTTLFATGDGRLSLQHPDQIDMHFDRERRRADAIDV